MCFTNRYNNSSPEQIEEACMKLLNSLLGGKAAVYKVAPKIDERGSLVPVDLSEINFPIKRVLLIKASSNIERGGHGHYHGRQFLMHVSGTIEIELRYKGKIETEKLAKAGDCLLIEHGVWSIQKYSDKNSALMVCCDTSYDESDYFYLEQMKATQ
jgi:mannose-6-phosphate isomerase-like protein (cupin superfamily)|tara:strand:+ start:211 stop:678 length:468 start_codon:yes stop_codon:yes gene_type:complete